jgi:ribonuclease P/MRP protein subunit RPP1
MDQEKHNYSTTNHKIMQSYDLVAVKPMTDKLFQLACNQLEVDIIMIDPSSRLRVKQSTINQALRRGITFEISYGPLIRSNESRKQILMNAAELMRKTKGKQTIVTSDLQSVMDMRNPLDIINLCTLLQMNPEIARNAIFENSRYCVLKGIARSKTYRGVLSVQLPDHKRQHSEQDGSNKKIKQSTAFAQAL